MSSVQLPINCVRPLFAGIVPSAGSKERAKTTGGPTEGQMACIAFLDALTRCQEITGTALSCVAQLLACRAPSSQAVKSLSIIADHFSIVIEPCLAFNNVIAWFKQYVADPAASPYKYPYCQKVAVRAHLGLTAQKARIEKRLTLVNLMASSCATISEIAKRCFQSKKPLFVCLDGVASIGKMVISLGYIVDACRKLKAVSTIQKSLSNKTAGEEEAVVVLPSRFQFDVRVIRVFYIAQLVENVAYGVIKLSHFITLYTRTSPRWILAKIQWIQGTALVATLTRAVIESKLVVMKAHYQAMNYNPNF